MLVGGPFKPSVGLQLWLIVIRIRLACSMGKRSEQLRAGNRKPGLPFQMLDRGDKGSFCVSAAYRRSNKIYVPFPVVRLDKDSTVLYVENPATASLQEKNRIYLAGRMIRSAGRHDI